MNWLDFVKEHPEFSYEARKNIDIDSVMEKNKRDASERVRLAPSPADTAVQSNLAVYDTDIVQRAAREAAARNAARAQTRAAAVHPVDWRENAANARAQLTASANTYNRNKVNFSLDMVRRPDYGTITKNAKEISSSTPGYLFTNFMQGAAQNMVGLENASRAAADVVTGGKKTI